MRKQYTRHHSEFGQPMIDKKTGEQKISNDGTPRYANIPCHIKLVKKMEEESEGFNFPIGDTIKYVIGEPILLDIKPESRKKLDKEKFGKIYDEYKDFGLNLIMMELTNAGIKYKEVRETTQRAISVDDWKNGASYDKDHYWEMIMKPVAEILAIVYPETYFIDFGELIGFSDKKIQKMLEELEDSKEDTDKEDTDKE